MKQLEPPKWQVSPSAYCYECGAEFPNSVSIAMSESSLVGEKLTRFDKESASRFAHSILIAIGEEKVCPVCGEPLKPNQTHLHPND